MSTLSNDVFSKLAAAVSADESEPTIANLVEQLRALAGNFAYFYTGCLLARTNNGRSAVRILRRAGEDQVCQCVAAALESDSLDTATLVTTQSPAALSIWNRVGFAREERRIKVQWFMAWLRQQQSLKSRFTLLDIGTGDGVLLAEILNQVFLEGFATEVRAVLLDKSAAMVEASANHCRKAVTHPVEFVSFKGDVGALSLVQQRQLRGLNVTVALASECLHHLPAHLKIKTFSTLSGLAPDLLLAELEGRHDLLEPGSPRLLLSVWRFYGGLLRSLEEEKLGAEDERLCREQLLLPEIARLILCDRSHRGEYHCASRRWIKLANEGGYEVNHSDRCVVRENHSPLTLLELKSRPRT